MAEELTDFQKILVDDKLVIVKDVYPWKTISVESPAYITKAVVKSLELNTGANICQAEILMPSLYFGDHVDYHMPVKILLKSTGNILFRGFIINETARLSENGDEVNVTAYCYKWYFGKITRIRGKWYTVSEKKVPKEYGSPDSLGNTKLKYEMFKGEVAQDDGKSGYMQNEACIFNEGALPDCATSNYAIEKKCIFKKRLMFYEDGTQYVTKYNYSAYYWDFRAILNHLLYYWINPYLATGVSVKIATSTFQRLSPGQFDDDTQATPFNLSINDKNPLEAIDDIVKMIPGKWFWYLDYKESHNIYIEIKNIDDNAEVRDITVGDGSKIAINAIDAGSITVTRDTSESIRYLILKGGKIKFTTTLELLPVFSVNSELMPFPDTTQGKSDCSEWLKYIMENAKKFKSNSTYKALEDFVEGDQETNEDGDDEETDTSTSEAVKKIDPVKEKILRYYCIPFEGGLLKEVLDAVTYKKEVNLQGRLATIYGGYEIDLKNMVAENMFVNREFESPLNKNIDQVVVFAYDENYKWNLINQTKDMTRAFKVFTKEEFDFDEDRGLFIFKEPQFVRYYNYKEDKKENKEIEEYPNSPSVTSSIFKKLYDDDKISKDTLKNSNNKLRTRRIFATVTISLDVPYLVGQDCVELVNLVRSNFSRYMDFEGFDLKVVSNAFYPVNPDKPITLKKSNKVSLTTDIDVDANTIKNVLYPCDYAKDYEMFVDSSDKTLLQMLDNHALSIIPYKENIAVEIDFLDPSFALGKKISQIKNSMNEIDQENNIGGYFNLKNYINNISINLAGETASYQMTVNATNEIDFTASEYNKKLVKAVRAPSILKGKYQFDSFLTVSEFDEVE